MNILLHGNKRQDFNDFVCGISLVQKRDHLTQSGLDKLHEIVLGMNNNRKLWAVKNIFICWKIL